MSRKKRKPEKQRYLPDARWEDVMYGCRAVTQDDVERAKRRRVEKLTYQCRNCSFSCRLVRRAGTVRCVKCGGVLDPLIRR